MLGLYHTGTLAVLGSGFFRDALALRALSLLGATEETWEFSTDFGTVGTRGETATRLGKNIREVATTFGAAYHATPTAILTSELLGRVLRKLLASGQTEFQALLLTDSVLTIFAPHLPDRAVKKAGWL